MLLFCTMYFSIIYFIQHGRHTYISRKPSVVVWAVLHTYNHLSSGLECWNGCLVVVVSTFILQHTYYVFLLLYTTRPALCKELHSVLAFLLTIKYQMIVQGFRVYICLTYSSVRNRRAGQNKHAGGKILKKTLNVQVKIDVQGKLFLENT